VRVVVVAESWTPDVNGVTRSVAQVRDHLVRRGHECLVVAPEARHRPVVDHVPTVRVPAVRWPGAGVSVGLPGPRVAEVLRAEAPDVVHLAAPFCLGAQAARVADRLGVPSVAVYQTDVAAFAAGYGLGAGRSAAWRWTAAVHALAGRTLAPSSAAVADLHRHRVPRVHLWPRGVDAVAFAPAHRSARLRERWAPGGEVVVGYVGRLAPEKQLHLLEPLSRTPGVRLVLVGDGPARAELRERLPGAVLTGHLSGAALSTATASLDVFVHPGRHETFCQSLQEALAAGVPAVAPAAGGPLDLVRPGTGLLFAPDDAEDLRRCVLELVGDDDRRRAAGAAARASVRDRTWESVGDLLLGHYAAVLAGDDVAALPPPRAGGSAATRWPGGRRRSLTAPRGAA